MSETRTSTYHASSSKNHWWRSILCRGHRRCTRRDGGRKAIHIWLPKNVSTRIRINEMRFWSFVFLAAFSLNCSSEDTEAERASGIGGNESASTTTGRGGTSAGAGSGGTATGSGGVATSTGAGSVTTGGGSVATGGAAGFSGGGGSTGSGGAAKDASVETGPPPDPGPLSGGGAGCNEEARPTTSSAPPACLTAATTWGRCRSRLIGWQ